MTKYAYNDFAFGDEKCMGQIVIVPEGDNLYKFHVYVAWEYRTMAEHGQFKCYGTRSPIDFRDIDAETINEVCEYGRKLTPEEVKQIFPMLLDGKEVRNG